MYESNSRAECGLCEAAFVLCMQMICGEVVRATVSSARAQKT